MKNTLPLSVVALCLSIFSAQANDLTSSWENGKQQIKGLSGCFNVIYRYLEGGTTAFRTGFSGPFHQHEFYDLLLEQYEWIDFSEENSNEPSGYEATLKHYSVDEEKKRVSHWAEVWSFDVDTFQWAQKVLSRGEVRYGASGPWVFNQWNGFGEKAGKPLRDRAFSDRSDKPEYEFINRDNTLQVTPKGWVHMQRNSKLTSEGQAVANEVGFNEYRRVENSFCGF